MYTWVNYISYVWPMKTANDSDEFARKANLNAEVEDIWPQASVADPPLCLCEAGDGAMGGPLHDFFLRDRG